MPQSVKRQREKARLIYAASENFPDLLYATGFFAPDPFLLLIEHGRKILLVGDLEFDRARRQACVDEVLSLKEWEKRYEARRRQKPATAQLLNFFLRQRGISRVQIPFDTPAGLAIELRRLGMPIEVKAPPFFEERQIKSTEELRHIVAAQRAAESALAAAIQTLRESSIGPRGRLVWQGRTLTSETLKLLIARTTMEKECIASHTIVACGQQGCEPHREGNGPLKAHQPIIIDIFPRSQKTGYWGDLTRTVVKGRASETLQALYATVGQAKQQALRLVKPGTTGAEIHQAVHDFYAAQGYKTGLIDGRMQGFFHGTGHGVGVEIHELPRIGWSGTEPLERSQVLTIEPGLYYPGIGGVRLEDLVVVTDSGCRNLTRAPHVFEID